MKNKNKKLLLALGTIATVAAPVAAVVSCGSGDDQKVRHFNLLPTYTGQADQLIALGIHADYYPEQLNVQKPYDYLTNPGQYMTQQDDAFKAKFAKAVNGLLPKTQGVSWWNQDAKNSDDDRISNTYWQKQEGSVLLYEHYLLDDGQKVVESAWAPKHQPQTAIQTNFRASRDPYTRIPKGVFFGWDLSDSTLHLIASGKTIGTSDIKVLDKQGSTGSEETPASNTEFTAAGTTVNVKLANLKAGTTDQTAGVVVDQDSAKIILAMRAKRAQMLESRTGASDWFYNDWFFVDSFHRTYLDNKDFQDSPFLDWMLDSTKENEFAQVATTTGITGADATLKVQQDDIKALFDASTFQGDEVKAGLAPTSRAGTTTAPHHPIYEQQEGEVGAAPMFEGAMRDNQLYLFNVAWQVSNLAKTGTPYGADFVASLPDETPEGSPADFSVARSKAEAKTIKDYVAKQVTPTQLKEMASALTNANTITSQLKARMTAMNKYFKALGVNGKTFGLMTIAPGHGVSTLQTMSKYSFIYKELGFAQPIPSDLHTNAEAARKMTSAWTAAGVTLGENEYLKDGVVDGSGTDGAAVKKAIGAGSVFNMDDNGWFWTLGNSGAIDADKLSLFKGTIDLGVVASRDANYDAEVKANSGINEMIAGMFKGYKEDDALVSKESALAKATNALSANEEEIEVQQAIIDNKTTSSADLAKAKTALADAKGKTAGLTTAETTAQAAADAAVEASTGSTAKAFVGKLREHANYDLWNEGLKTPFVMDMLLDQIMTKSEEYFLEKHSAEDLANLKKIDANKYATAKSWGNYFTTDFVKDAK